MLGYPDEAAFLLSAVVITKPGRAMKSLCAMLVRLRVAQFG